MTQAPSDSAFPLLSRSLQLLSWWRPMSVGSSAADLPQLERFRSLLQNAHTAMLDAGEKQANAVAALNEELPGLILAAARARDPQAMLEAELAIAARIRRCTAECCEVWSGAMAWPKAPAVEKEAPPPAGPEGLKR